MANKLIIVISVVVVAAGGILAWHFWPSASSPSPSPSPNETAGWKVYRNEEFGFELKYPRDWAVIEAASPEHPYLVFVTLGPQKTIQQGGLFAVTIRDQTEDEYLVSLKQEGFYVISRTDSTIGDKKASIYTFGRAGSTGIQWKEVVAQKDGFLVQFSRGATSNQESIFNQMLSTFKFIE